MSSLALIVACTTKNGIGKDGGLPWKLPKEMAYFRQATMSCPPGTRNAVIMGRNTWESIPPKFRPLRERVNVVVTSRDLPDLGEALKASSLHEALERLKGYRDLHHIFVIGGAQLYSAALKHPSTHLVLMTRVVQPDFDCDTFFPLIEETGEWVEGSYQELLQYVRADASAVPEQTEEKDTIWKPQLWKRT